MKHLNLEMEKLEQRIAPGGLCSCGCGGSNGSNGSNGSKSGSHGSKSGSHGSKGSKSN
jgi:hypothetical protein